MLSTTILKNLIHNPEYSVKVISYLLPEYFDNRLESMLMEEISSFVSKYDSLPSEDALKIMVQGRDLSISRKEIEDKFSSFLKLEEEKNLEWLVDSTEKFCQDAALRNAILKSVDIVEGNEESLTKESIPDILKDALSVGFDTSIGHNYFEDAESRLEFNTSEVIRLPIGIDKIDKITKGGLKPKTLTIFYAGCVHPKTTVHVRINNKTKICFIGEIKEFLERYDLVEVESPDGWVKVSEYVEKGEYEEYQLNLTNTYTEFPTRTNSEHLYETTLGWYSAEQLSEMEEGLHFLTRKGYEHGYVTRNPGSKIPIVDILVDHPNHRYYTDNVSSHNTGVGKTHFMCAIAANLIRDGKNVLYISMEMYEEAIGERIDANLIDIDIGEVYLNPNRFLKRLNHVKEKSKGGLVIKEYPTCSASTADFERLLDELKIKKGFVPELICVDYMSICKSRRYKVAGTNSYTYVKGISEELRAMAQKYNVAVITGAQVNRGGFGAEKIEMTDAAESFGGNFIADLVLGLNIDKNNPDKDTMIVSQLKNRYSSIDNMSKFLVRIDRSKMRVINEEEFEEQEEAILKEKDKLRSRYLKK